MTTDETCPACGEPICCMPSLDYFVEIVSCCFEKLEACSRIPCPYKAENWDDLERDMIDKAKMIFCHIHRKEIDSKELEQINAVKTLAGLAGKSECRAFLNKAAWYIRQQLIQAYGAPDAHESGSGVAGSPAWVAVINSPADGAGMTHARRLGSLCL